MLGMEVGVKRPNMATFEQGIDAAVDALLHGIHWRRGCWWLRIGFHATSTAGINS